jgi:hypothetical protein
LCNCTFFEEHAAALAKDNGTIIKDASIELFWSCPTKSRGRPKDNSPACAFKEPV